jgi:hypothetical protein
LRLLTCGCLTSKSPTKFNGGFSFSGLEDS